MLADIVRRFPLMRVVVLADRSQIQFAVASLSKGVWQYMMVPVSDEELAGVVDLAVRQPPGDLPGSGLDEGIDEILGSSPQIEAVRRQILQAAGADIPVLITGETGTGKDVAAGAIHRVSARRDRPFVVAHVGAMAPQLVGSELFGHVRGAFTGAIGSRPGRFEEADGGTIFLDEISTMDEKAQVTLLRVIEKKQLRRLGGRRVIKVDVRVIAASNEDLYQLASRGRFREDLLYRLDVFRINIPPLRDRGDDVTMLANEFLNRFSKQLGKSFRRVPPRVEAVFRRYSWPGNVRELRSVVQRAVVVARSRRLAPEHFPGRLWDESRHVKPGSLVFAVGTSLRDFEKQAIERTLQWTNNKAEAARLLGISRRALYDKMKRLGISL
jgi:DNA-binding NtrC family response regulator